MQPKKAPKTRRKYDADFKAEVLKMLDSGQTAVYVANALGVSENLIYRWRSVNQVGKKVVAGQSELTVENQQLKERVRQLETEREILKKALSIFSRAT
jgi:transposase